MYYLIKFLLWCFIIQLLWFGLWWHILTGSNFYVINSIKLFLEIETKSWRILHAIWIDQVNNGKLMRVSLDLTISAWLVEKLTSNQMKNEKKCTITIFLVFSKYIAWMTGAFKANPQIITYLLTVAIVIHTLIDI